jgi:hypothetical protein
MLTEAKCRTSRPGQKADGTLKTAMLSDRAGLYLQVTPGANGAINRSWIYRYSLAGHDQVMGLGAYPGVNLAAARKLAASARAERAAGKDPKFEKRRRLEAAATKLAEQTAKPTPVKTFDQCAALYWSMSSPL